MIRKFALVLLFACGPLVSAHGHDAAQAPTPALDFGPCIVISARDEELAVIDNGKVEAKYNISTSKYGLGDNFGSYKTPLGDLWVCNKIGDNLPPGTVIRHRYATGEVVAPNAPGRDPIISRVIWLRGMDSVNKNAYQRCIYIHGTPEENLLGKKASYGCIRMRSNDIIALYDLVRIGTRVTITDKPLSAMLPSKHLHFSLLSFW